MGAKQFFILLFILFHLQLFSLCTSSAVNEVSVIKKVNFHLYFTAFSHLAFLRKVVSLIVFDFPELLRKVITLFICTLIFLTWC